MGGAVQGWVALFWGRWGYLGMSRAIWGDVKGCLEGAGAI